jgi:hypothetical protein
MLKKESASQPEIVSTFFVVKRIRFYIPIANDNYNGCISIDYLHHIKDKYFSVGGKEFTLISHKDHDSPYILLKSDKIPNYKYPHYSLVLPRQRRIGIVLCNKNKMKLGPWENFYGALHERPIQLSIPQEETMLTTCNIIRLLREQYKK